MTHMQIFLAVLVVTLGAIWMFDIKWDKTKEGYNLIWFTDFNGNRVNINLGKW